MSSNCNLCGENLATHATACRSSEGYKTCKCGLRISQYTDDRNQSEYYENGNLVFKKCCHGNVIEGSLPGWAK